MKSFYKVCQAPGPRAGVSDQNICSTNVDMRSAVSNFLVLSAVVGKSVYKYVTRSSADADNGLDAFSGQSRSRNMVPFWVHCDFSLSM